MEVVLAFDIGGTKSGLSVYEVVAGRELARLTVPTDGNDYAHTRDQLQMAVVPHVIGRRVVGAGVGVAAPLKDGVIGEKTSNMPDWAGRNLRVDFGERFNVSVVETFNDCEAAALGEYSHSHCPFVYVGWGTGIGVAKVYESNGLARTQPTELGHMIIDLSSEFQCGCGGYGHLEAHVGGTNMQQRFGRRARELDDSQWSEVLHDLAAGLRSLSAGDMELPIVIGGGVMNKQAHRLPGLQTMVDDLPSTSPPPKLILARLGENSALVGAAYAVRQLLA